MSDEIMQRGPQPCPTCDSPNCECEKIAEQNIEAALVSQNELRELGIGDRRKETRNG